MQDLAPDVRRQIADRIEATSQLTGDYEKDTGFKEFEPQKFDFGQLSNMDAIQRRAQAKFYDPALANIRAEQKAGYAGEVQNQLKRAQNLGMGQLRYDNARALAAAQRVAQEEAQRAAMIGSLFQAGGAIGGFMLGGPAGAMVGSQVGGAASGSGMAGGGGAKAPGTMGKV